MEFGDGEEEGESHDAGPTSPMAEALTELSVMGTESQGRREVRDLAPRVYNWIAV